MYSVGILLFCYYLLLKKGMAPHLKNLELSLPKDSVEIGSEAEDFHILSTYFRYLERKLPLC